MKSLTPDNARLFGTNLLFRLELLFPCEGPCASERIRGGISHHLLCNIEVPALVLFYIVPEAIIRPGRPGEARSGRETGVGCNALSYATARVSSTRTV